MSIRLKFHWDFEVIGEYILQLGGVSNISLWNMLVILFDTLFW